MYLPHKAKYIISRGIALVVNAFLVLIVFNWIGIVVVFGDFDSLTYIDDVFLWLVAFWFFVLLFLLYKYRCSQWVEQMSPNYMRKKRAAALRPQQEPMTIPAHCPESV